jgi:hypothetical protein
MFQTRHIFTNCKPLLVLGLIMLLNMDCKLFAQPTQLGTQTVNGAYVSYPLSDMGIFRQARIQATSSALSGTRNWEFYEAPFDYDPAWRPYTGGLTLAGYNMNIFPTGGTAAALFNTGFGGSAGLMPTIANGYYYTFNVTEYSTPGVPQNEYMGVVETSYDPVVITSVVQSPAAGAVYPENSVYVTVTVAAIPSPGENVFVRYSSSPSFLTSSLLEVTMVGTTGIVEIPCASASTTIYYYAYTSNRTGTAILTDVGVTGQRAHDMSTLNINNNGGPNYSYTVLPSIGFCGDYYVPSVCYPTINSFVNALNAGSVSCDVVCYVAAGHTETAPVGGINLTQTGTAANTITFQKIGGGANPVINAQVGTITLGGASTVVDGVFSLNGSDYITIDGIDIIDNNASAPATMEYGYALYKNSDLDGCSFNIIQNCNITLNKSNSSTGPGTFQNGSRGIFLANCLRTDLSSFLVITTPGGRSDGNAFLSNTITNVFSGIIIRGYNDASPSTYFDQGNIIGTAANGNTITNYGGASSNATYGIYCIYQNALTISGNTINNKLGGSSHTATLYGIFHSAFTGNTTASSTITANDISLGQGNNGSSVFGIRAGAAGYSGGIINISNNTIHDCTFDVGATGQFIGINQEFNNSIGIIDNNIIKNNNLNTTNTNNYLIYDNGVTPDMSISGNHLTNNTLLITSGNLIGCYYVKTTATGTINVENNVIDTLFVPTPGTGYVIGIRVSNTTAQIKNINGNSISNIRAGSGVTAWTCGMYIDYMPTGSTVTNNTVTNISSTSNVVGINCTSSNLLFSSSNQIFTFTGNNVANVSSSGTAAQMAGIAIYALNAVTCSNNTVDNVFTTGTSPTQLKGFNFGGGTSGNTLIFSGNTISNITHNNIAGTGTVVGLYLFPNTVTTNIYANDIRQISGTGNNMIIAMYGTSGTGTYNVYNNFIQQLSAPNASSLTALNGMYVAASGNTYNVYNNTIAIGEDAVVTSTGTNFGVSGFYHGAGALNLQNNIIYINATTVGTGVASCLRKATPGTAGTAPATTSIAATTNNNFYYINPAANNYVYVEGGSTVLIKNGYAYSGATTSVTNNLNNDPCFNVLTASDITSYKYFMSLSGGGTREVNSFYDVPNFAGGAVIPDNLKITLGATDYAESHATSLALVTTDYEGDIRQGVVGYGGTGTAPDIGADEGEFVLVAAVCDLLPIELVEFTGWYNGVENELHWTTATEINSNYFEIQRSLNGIDFIAIGTTPAAGNSMELLNYIFYDDAPGSGINYYRLKMVDIDGSYDYSNIIAIRLNNVMIQQITVFPNPSNNEITIEYLAAEEENIQIDFLDATGRKVISENRVLMQGINMFQYEIVHLPNATYFIQFTNTKTGNINGVQVLKY